MASHKNGERILFSHLYPKSAIAESFRTLRTNISFTSLDRSNKVILITSPGPEDGKSTVASNLSVVMAQTGSRVLIIDCDLRRPVMHKYFERDNQRGITNLLVKGLDIDDVVYNTDVEGLSLITSGPIPPNPSELLGSSKMAAFLEKIAEQYDVVLIDAPPVMAVTDASVLASRVDSVLLVLKAGETRIEMAKEAKEQLLKANAKSIWVVLNDVKMRGDGYHRYYYYYYGSSDKLSESSVTT